MWRHLFKFDRTKIFEWRLRKIFFLRTSASLLLGLFCLKLESFRTNITHFVIGCRFIQTKKQQHGGVLKDNAC